MLNITCSYNLFNSWTKYKEGILEICIYIIRQEQVLSGSVCVREWVGWSGEREYVCVLGWGGDLSTLQDFGAGFHEITDQWGIRKG